MRLFVVTGKKPPLTCLTAREASVSKQIVSKEEVVHQRKRGADHIVRGPIGISIRSKGPVPNTVTELN